MNNKTLQFVAEAIKDIYKCSIIEAQSIVSNSFLPELLKEIPDHVQHYDAEYWAKEIMEDFSVSQLNMNYNYLF